MSLSVTKDHHPCDRGHRLGCGLFHLAESGSLTSTLAANTDLPYRQGWDQMISLSVSPPTNECEICGVKECGCQG